MIIEPSIHFTKLIWGLKDKKFKIEMHRVMMATRDTSMAFTNHYGCLQLGILVDRVRADVRALCSTNVSSNPIGHGPDGRKRRFILDISFVDRL